MGDKKHAKAEIRSFIVENFLYGQDDGYLSDNVSFLKRGIIDSTGILELVSFIEEKYGIFINDEELVPDNFDSIDKLSTFVSRKKGPAENINHEW
jgi:acyl carrier protein